MTADHGGLAAGSEIQIGYAEADVQTAPRVTATVTTTTTETVRGADRRPDRRRCAAAAPTGRRRGEVGAAQAAPEADRGRYVFPVYGATSYIDTYGAARSDVTYHHGDDIFGQLGQPLVAVADGTVFSVGWNKVGGNRLWILDQQGNQFYYAHLSAFSTSATNGAHVKAGQVVGFMGNTGDAEGTPYHLHFEVHPGVAVVPRLRRRGRPDALPRCVEAPAGPAVPDRRRVGAGGPRVGPPRRSPARSCSA